MKTKDRIKHSINFVPKMSQQTTLLTQNEKQQKRSNNLKKQANIPFKPNISTYHNENEAKFHEFK